MFLLFGIRAADGYGRNETTFPYSRDLFNSSFCINRLCLLDNEEMHVFITFLVVEGNIDFNKFGIIHKERQGMVVYIFKSSII